MGMFSDADGGSRRKTAVGGDPREPRFSVVAGGMQVAGEITSDSVVKIEGTVEGNVRAEGQVLVAKGGLVIGDIVTGEAIIGGEVRGSVVAENRVEIQPGSVVNGDITAPQLAIHEGGEVNGLVRTRRPAVSPGGDADRAGAGGATGPSTTEIPDFHPVGASAGGPARWG